MGLNTDAAWERFGRSDPYFGVMSWPEFHQDRIAETRDAFFATGRRDVDATVAQIRRLYGEVPRGRMLDFGCGVGRLLREFARHYGEAVGVDVSDAMLAEARANTGGLANVSLSRSDDNLSELTGSFDLVHSYIVLQHIPVERGLAMADRMLAMVRPGGCAVLHFSVGRTLSPVREAVYQIKHKVPFGRQVMNVLQRRPLSTPAMEMNNYPLERIVHIFERRGLTDLMVEPEFHSVALTVRVYGRNPGRLGPLPS